MSAFTELRAVATRLDEGDEFPIWLLTDIVAIADKPEQYIDKVHLVELLVTQISNFDPYAGAGYFDSSVSAETIGATIRQILACR